MNHIAGIQNPALMYDRLPYNKKLPIHARTAGLKGLDYFNTMLFNLKKQTFQVLNSLPLSVQNDAAISPLVKKGGQITCDDLLNVIGRMSELAPGEMLKNELETEATELGLAHKQIEAQIKIGKQLKEVIEVAKEEFALDDVLVKRYKCDGIKDIDFDKLSAIEVRNAYLNVKKLFEQAFSESVKQGYMYYNDDDTLMTDEETEEYREELHDKQRKVLESIGLMVEDLRDLDPDIRKKVKALEVKKNLIVNLNHLLVDTYSWDQKPTLCGLGALISYIESNESLLNSEDKNDLKNIQFALQKSEKLTIQNVKDYVKHALKIIVKGFGEEMPEHIADRMAKLTEMRKELIALS